MEARARRFNYWSLLGGRALLQEPRFRRLWLQHAIGQLGQNALHYSLLILVVKDTTSSVFTGLLLLAFIVPATVLGPLSGVFIDHFSRGLILATTNALRAALCIALLFSGQSVWELYLFALAFSAAAQFVGPAVNASLPQVVKQEELTYANSVFNFGGMMAQAVGVAILAPVLLKTVGADPLFVMVAVFFAMAAFLVTTIPGLTSRATGAQLQHAVKGGIRTQFALAWQTLRRDPPSYLALIISVVGTASLIVCVTVLPRYAREELGVSAENIIFIFAPGAIGIFLGLRLVSGLSRIIGKGWTQALGFVVFVLSILSFGLVANEAQFIASLNPLGIAHPGPLHGQGARVAVTMVTAIFTGFGSSLINVASRAIINERIPMEMQGRVFAAQAVLANLASVAPLLVAGVLADLVGVRPVLVALAVTMALFVGWAALRSRSVPAATESLNG